MKKSVNRETEGCLFVTDQDVKKAKQPAFRLDPTGRAVMSILRHLGRIRESRGGGVTRFILQ